MADENPHQQDKLDRFFAKFTMRMLYDPIWSGGRIPFCTWRVLGWMILHTTANTEGYNEALEPDGVTWGVVKGNTPVTFTDIAGDLQCTWRHVQEGVNWLYKKGLIERHRKGNGAYCFAVRDSNRTFNNEKEVTK